MSYELPTLIMDYQQSAEKEENKNKKVNDVFYSPSKFGGLFFIIFNQDRSKPFTDNIEV